VPNKPKGLRLAQRHELDAENIINSKFPDGIAGNEYLMMLSITSSTFSDERSLMVDEFFMTLSNDFMTSSDFSNLRLGSVTQTQEDSSEAIFCTAFDRPTIRGAIEAAQYTLSYFADSTPLPVRDCDATVVIGSSSFTVGALIRYARSNQVSLDELAFNDLPKALDRTYRFPIIKIGQKEAIERIAEQKESVMADLTDDACQKTY